MLVPTFAEPCSGKRRRSRSQCRANSRVGPGIPVVSVCKLPSPEDQGLRGLGFMGSRFLGLEFLVAGFLDVPGFGGV